MFHVKPVSTSRSGHAAYAALWVTVRSCAVAAHRSGGNLWDRASRVRRPELLAEWGTEASATHPPRWSATVSRETGAVRWPASVFRFACEQAARTCAPTFVAAGAAIVRGDCDSLPGVCASGPPREVQRGEVRRALGER